MDVENLEDAEDLEMENFCDGCDWPVDTVCNAEDFWAHKVGRVKCPKCGAVMMPCNECAAETPLSERDCENCPWKEAEVLEDAKTEGGAE